MDVWFWADTHFGHSNIIKYERRPFKDIEEMDNALIENFNETVKPGDLIFWLGDIFFTNATRTKEICSQLRLSETRNILIRGNHDRRFTNQKFKSLGFFPVRMYQFESLILTHEPLSEANLMYLRDYGGNIRNVHGHTHSQDTGLSPILWQCVSVELTSYRPLHLDELFSLRRVM